MEGSVIAHVDGYQEDFEKLTCKHVESEKVLRSPFKLKRILASPGRMRRESSALDNGEIIIKIIT